MSINPTEAAKPDLTTGAKIAHEPSMAQVPRTVAAAQSASTSEDDVAQNTKLIAECAYFAAERRNFTGGDPVQDWLLAEREVCSKNP